MVDEKKSMQAKRRHRKSNGEFADENKTNIPQQSAISDYERQRLDKAVLAAQVNIGMDTDVSEYSDYATSRINELIARPAMQDEPDDMPLILANMQYDPNMPDGSHADYLVDDIRSAFDGVPVKTVDRRALEEETRRYIIATAVNPDKALDEFGMPHVQPDEIMTEDRKPTSDELAEIRYQAALKGARTKQKRYAAAEEKHLAPLNERMLDLYRKNVDRGLINGSAFEDKMAFADALHELQEDDWNPENGKTYRQSKEFKKLEKQLLDGRKPTRRYRQLRDALCDNEQEYRRFMNANPDVFNPDEKTVKPFAGLGPDVGQQAMLRLASKHRGVDGALKLARQDPSIDYTVGDAKTHTFRSTHDELRMTYLSDGSPYKPEHTVITANGIKPASIMSWIHGEQPGSPEWENRARNRFAESNGGDWEPAKI